MKNKSTIINLITLSIIILSNTLQAQDSKQDSVASRMFNNAIYGNLGVGGLYFTATGYYERIIIQNSKISHFIKVGAGEYALWGIGGEYILGQYGILTGRKNHHLELSAGVKSFLNGDLKGSNPLSGTIGYRIQKPEGRFIFRTGVSWPEALYIGLGASF